MLYTSIFGLGVNLLMVMAIHYDHFIGDFHEHSHEENIHKCGKSHNHKHDHHTHKKTKKDS
jgi:hypothetical protein